MPSHTTHTTHTSHGTHTIHTIRQSLRPLLRARTLLYLAILCLLQLFSSACQPMSRAESDRIMNDYDNFYHRTRGVPVRHVDK